MNTENNELEYAGFWIRVWASILDTILMSFITVPVLVSVYGSDYWIDEQFINGWMDFIFSYLLPAIIVIVFWIYKGATPGKMAISAKIVDAETGAMPTPGQCIGRYLAYCISMLPLGLGLIWVAFDKRKQGWHDKLAGTVVVRDKSGGVEPVQFTQK